MEILREIGEFFASGRGYDLLRATVLLVVGLVLASLLSRGAHRVVLKYFDIQRAMLGRRIVYYLVVVLTAISVLNELGFSLTVLLGAAGVLSVAIGFASQTSASNLISGLFLIAEKPFIIGDIITVGGTTGEVLSIDLLSVKLRTFDNLYVRVPNQTLIQSEITNLSRFPIRRFDLKVGVAYKEDLDRVRKVLLDVAENNPLSLENPAPLIIFLGYGDSSLDMQLSVWALRENFLALRNSIATDVKKAFDREGIEIPFPHLSLYTGEETKPFPVVLEKAEARETD
jgi:small-conductance mechanosensitive channel